VGDGGTKENLKNASKFEIYIFSLLISGNISGLHCYYEAKSNIKPQNMQNLFRIGGGLPLPHPYLHLVVSENLERSY